MTIQRATEIWTTKGPFGEFKVNAEEDAEIKKIWSTMSSSSSWVSALLFIASGKTQSQPTIKTTGGQS